jgi:hypothetical protein
MLVFVSKSFKFPPYPQFTISNVNDECLTPKIPSLILFTPAYTDFKQLTSDILLLCALLTHHPALPPTYHSRLLWLNKFVSSLST